MLEISLTRLAKKSLPSIDKVQNIEVGRSGSNDNKMIKRSPSYKKLIIRTTNYLTFEAKKTFM